MSPGSEKRMQKKFKASDNTLYDAGGWLLLFMAFGIPVVGVVLDYFWNYLILHLSLRKTEYDIETKRKIIYCLIATGFGLLIDWIYYEVTWGNLILGDFRITAIFQRPVTQRLLEISTIIIPMIVLFIVNFILSISLLDIKKKNSLTVAAFMGIFTAPWLVLAVVFLF
jgi:hypothetical protein